ncbi:hypothetical protein GINT2_002035 [Glugoides intestinalis]
MQEQNLNKETLQLINLWKLFMWSSLPGGRATTTMFIGATITLFIIIAFVRQVYFNEIISIWNIGVMIILYGIISGKGLEILFKVQRAYSGAYGDIDYSSFAISKDLFYGIGFLILGSWLLYRKLFNELESAPERNRERVQEKEKPNAFLHNEKEKLEKLYENMPRNENELESVQERNRERVQEKEKTNAFLHNEKEKLEEIYGSMPRNENELESVQERNKKKMASINKKWLDKLGLPSESFSKWKKEGLHNKIKIFLNNSDKEMKRQAMIVQKKENARLKRLEECAKGYLERSKIVYLTEKEDTALKEKLKKDAEEAALEKRMKNAEKRCSYVSAEYKAAKKRLSYAKESVEKINIHNSSSSNEKLDVKVAEMEVLRLKTVLAEWERELKWANSIKELVVKENKKTKAKSQNP